MLAPKFKLDTSLNLKQHMRKCAVGVVIVLSSTMSKYACSYETDELWNKVLAQNEAIRMRPARDWERSIIITKDGEKEKSIVLK